LTIPGAIVAAPTVHNLAVTTVHPHVVRRKSVALDLATETTVPDIAEDAAVGMKAMNMTVKKQGQVEIKPVKTIITVEVEGHEETHAAMQNQ